MTEPRSKKILIGESKKAPPKQGYNRDETSKSRFVSLAVKDDAITLWFFRILTPDSLHLASASELFSHAIIYGQINFFSTPAKKISRTHWNHHHLVESTFQSPWISKCLVPGLNDYRPTPWNARHCEHLNGAWQSHSNIPRLLRFARNEEWESLNLGPIDEHP